MWKRDPLERLNIGDPPRIRESRIRSMPVNHRGGWCFFFKFFVLVGWCVYLGR